jgi:hypothetical protein
LTRDQSVELRRSLINVPYASRHYAPNTGFFATKKCFRAGLISTKFMRPTGPFCHQQCELVNVPMFSGSYLPFRVVIGGAPLWEEARARCAPQKVRMHRKRCNFPRLP